MKLEQVIAVQEKSGCRIAYLTCGCCYLLNGRKPKVPRDTKPGDRLPCRGSH